MFKSFYLSIYLCLYIYHSILFSSFHVFFSFSSSIIICSNDITTATTIIVIVYSYRSHRLSSVCPFYQQLQQTSYRVISINPSFLSLLHNVTTTTNNNIMCGFYLSSSTILSIIIIIKHNY